VVVTGTWIRAWRDPIGEVRVQVVVEVANQADTRRGLAPGETAYRIVAPDRRVVAAGRFAHAFPAMIARGGHAWLVDTLSATFVEISELTVVEVDVPSDRAAPETAQGTGGLAVDVDAWTTAAEGGLVAGGTVTNEGPAVVPRAVIGVLFRDGAGIPLAGVYDVEAVVDLEPGGSVRFHTGYPGTPPIDPRDVASAEATVVPIER
jgi:hypothetical protein